MERYEPGRILERLLDGQARTGMVSLLAYMENRDALRLSRSASIHTAHTTMSTLLLGRGQGGLRKSIEVAVTRYTRTTEFYLSLILRRLNVDFRLYRSDGTEAADLLGEREYALVIGDEALRAYSQGYSIVMDIGSEFSRLYNLAPLYAVTVSSDEAEEEILRQGVRDSDMHRLECVPPGGGGEGGHKGRHSKALPLTHQVRLVPADREDALIHRRGIQETGQVNSRRVHGAEGGIEGSAKAGLGGAILSRSPPPIG
ncbi:hypothetical protein [Thermogymnomonas acidicola]|uniref:MqnA/MqnD/SBP family protein n=1 Tax=Thermogymnomonas acidicola TaxID=399579 RepID=UPI00094685F3|nr:MqnA/MqnD/SBP family protein [Thermogymnomonas acidicola]